jgi:hypothetical protein
MRTLIATVVAFALATTAGVVAVDRWGGAEACPPMREPVPEANVAGTYDSNFGPVYLEQRGARVTGTYTCCGGGSLSGYMRGDTITYSWQQPGANGLGVWRLERQPGGTVALVGSWGWDAERESGGAWNLQRRAVAAVAVAQ